METTTFLTAMIAGISALGFLGYFGSGLFDQVALSAPAWFLQKTSLLNFLRTNQKRARSNFEFIFEQVEFPKGEAKFFEQ